jgi:hypothetical protein
VAQKDLELQRRDRWRPRIHSKHSDPGALTRAFVPSGLDGETLKSQPPFCTRRQKFKASNMISQAGDH